MKFLFTYLVPAGLLATLLAVPSRAGDCHAVRSTGVYAGSYVGATYAPTYSHEVYPYAIPVAIIPSQFYSVAPELAVAAIVQAASDAAAQKAKSSPNELEAAVEKALLKFLQGQKPPAIPAGNDPPLGPPVEKPAPKGGQASAAAAVQKVANARCVQCHRAGDQAPDLTDVSKLDEKTRMRMLSRVMTDDPKVKMPKGKEGVAPDELEAFHAFALEASLK